MISRVVARGTGTSICVHPRRPAFVVKNFGLAYQNFDFCGQVRLDLQYIRSQSLWLDVTLLLKTIPAVLFGEGAY